MILEKIFGYALKNTHNLQCFVLFLHLCDYMLCILIMLHFWYASVHLFILRENKWREVCK